jgi:hypothetical protein
VNLGVAGRLRPDLINCAVNVESVNERWVTVCLPYTTSSPSSRCQRRNTEWSAKMKRCSQWAGWDLFFSSAVKLCGLVFMGMLMAAPSQAAISNFTVQVEDHNGNPVQGFRWLLEEDTTHPVTPGIHTTDTLSLTFHTSHTPVLKQGEAAGNSAVIGNVDDTKRYFISVLPFNGYSNGGAQVAFAGATSPLVKVVVAQNPIPAAQISILVFEDTQPINSTPDLPQEHGLPGFSVLLFDPAGQYGVAGGQITQDASGNPLGTSYNADGTVAQLGNGVILTDATGTARIRNLAPGKYGVQIVPPAGQTWRQTNTVEGTRTIDAFVKANEPSYFAEVGTTGHHVFFGFVQPFNCYNSAMANPAGYCAGAAAAGGSSVSGRIVNLHTSRPPLTTNFNGHPIPGCWIGLNDAAAGTGRGVYAQPCNADSTFLINNVPAGTYTLVVWDQALDVIFSTLNLTVPAGGAVALGDVPVFNWYHRMENIVFFDRNQNGFRDCVTPACDNTAQDDVSLAADQAFVNLRFRDGRVYQTMPIDISGVAPLEEVFPFFHWLVAEVSFSTLKATGATVTIDAGGAVVAGEVLNPQPQNCTAADVTAGVCTTVGAPLINPNTGNNLSRTETGPVLLEGFQGFIGQTNRVEWGKSNYAAGENGGISGIVFYAVTRAENDPLYAVGEEWEPGIPRVQVNLYRDADGLGGIADNNGDGVITHADVDNYPLGWSFGGVKGPEDVDRNMNGAFDLGDALRVAHSDSFDDNHPTGCQGAAYTIDTKVIDCYDGLRNFNQVRPAVFDGGYAFGPGTLGDPNDPPLAAGIYVVEAVPPPGYQLVKEEDKNVDFGNAYTPSPLLLPNICVGDAHLVPAYLSMQTDSAGTPYPGIAAADLVAAPYAGTTRRLCDRKQVRLSQGQNAAADFFLFTETPKASMVVGIILSNQGNEANPNAPTFGEKFAPPWLPVSFRDWTGREIVRVHADEWGKFNAMLPSTYSVNLPMPSGVSPNMLTGCMNDPGPVPNPAYDPVNNPGAPAMLVDPFYDRRFSQFCYTFQYMPGGTTYLDTPVQPIAAFAGTGKPLDCEQPDGAPLIHTVSGPNGSGPLVNAGDILTITAVGDMNVPNPAFDGVSVTNPTLIRHYGFGNMPGSITLGGVALTNVNWSDGIITATVPAVAATGQLAVTRADGLATPSGITVTVGPLPAGVAVHRVAPSAVAGVTPIQDAIDLAGPNDLILVQPGTYDEMVIMYKPVRLQGYGSYSTVINAHKSPPEKLLQWRTRLATLFSVGAFDLLPGQGAAVTPGASVLPDGEGAGITVVGKGSGLWKNRFSATNKARIDGLTITGATHGGGVYVNGYARQLEIGNNRIIGNQGQISGGIRLGHADLTSVTANGVVYTNADNGDINMHHNEVVQNGSQGGGAGGGISLYTGANNYRVNANYICGNFAIGSGGGIGHLGFSNNGRITSNTLLFNQSFNPTLASSGGGIYIAGQAPLAGVTAVTPGSGHVVVDGNLIQGNQAGSGDGGGIRLERINGADVIASPVTPGNWNRIKIFNNMVVNNVAGLAAGGISLLDALQVKIDHNTIAHNDSTATAGEAFVPGNPNASVPQPAGIVSHAHSDGLNSLIAAGASFNVYRNYSKPHLINNIIWENRSFHWAIQGTNPSLFGLLPNIGAGDAPVFSDLGVLGVTGRLYPQTSLLTDTTGYHASNRALDPSFVLGYFNGDRNQTLQGVTTSMQAPPAFDEGGNFIDVRFGPLTPGGSYHLNAGSPAIDAGSASVVNWNVELTVDYDGDTRPAGITPDMGADEVIQ